MRENFRDAEDRNFGIIGDNVHARGAHLITAHSENVDVRRVLSTRLRGCAAYMSPLASPAE